MVAVVADPSDPVGKTTKSLQLAVVVENDHLAGNMLAP
jgi:hypothetical protein